MNSVLNISKRFRDYANIYRTGKLDLLERDLITAADTIDKMAAAIELCEMALRELDNPILADQAKRAIADIGVKNDQNFR